MIVISVIRALWTNRSLVLHSAIILTLVGVSIWDSTVIINSFINDNRLTLVRTELANNSTRFLENITIYITSSELPEEWYAEMKATNFDQVRNVESAMKSLLDEGVFQLSSVNTSAIEGKLTALAIHKYLREMDSRSVYTCLIRGKSYCAYKGFQNLSVILRNGTELEAIEKEIASEIYYYFVGENPGIDDIPLTVHSVEDFGITMELDTVTFLAKNEPQTFDVRLPEQLENKTGSSIGTICIYAGQASMNGMLKRKIRHWFFLEIKNLGIHDKTETTPCTNEPEIITGFEKHPTCEDRGFLRQIVKKCGCVPFSEKKNYRKFRDVQDIEPPFCDLQHSYDCSLDDGPIEIASDDCPPSCITTRNQYTLSTVEIPSDEHDPSMGPFATIQIQSLDHSYVIFEDRFQSTTAQFIGQLGGDIGLYTGLSLLSIWQLIVFIHDLYKKYMRKSTVSGKSFWAELSEQFNVSSPKSDHTDQSMENMKVEIAKLSEVVTMLVSQGESLKRLVETGDDKTKSKQLEPWQAPSIDNNPLNISQRNFVPGGERIMSKRVLLADIAKMIQDEGRVKEERTIQLMREEMAEQRKAIVNEIMAAVKKNQNA